MTETERECRNSWDDADWAHAWREHQEWSRGPLRQRQRNKYVKADCPVCGGGGVTDHEGNGWIYALPCSGCSNPLKLDAAEPRGPSENPDPKA